MAPPGTFGLPPLLEQRRLEYLIPNGAFAQRAIYDRMLLWQIPYYRERYGDTRIMMSEQGKERNKNEAPRGIIVSAGLQALDVLHDHGSGLGNIVKFIRLAPWRLPCDMIGGKEEYPLILRAGDLIADEDLGAEAPTARVGRPPLNAAKTKRVTPSPRTFWWATKALSAIPKSPSLLRSTKPCHRWTTTTTSQRKLQPASQAPKSAWRRARRQGGQGRHRRCRRRRPGR